MAKARRVSMSYQPGEWRPVAELLHRVAPHMSAAGAAKLILAQVAKDKEIEAAVVTRCYDSLRPVTTRNESCNPDPAPAREPSTPEKSIVSELPRGLARRIADHLNSKAETRVRSTGKAFRGYIRARLSEGYTEEDFIRVIDFKAEEWMGTHMEEYVRPSTLFGQENFEKYAAQKRPLKHAAAKSSGRQTNLLPATSARHGMGDDEGYTDGKW